VQNTQQYIPSGIVNGAKSPCRSGLAFCEQAQFIFGQDEFRRTTIQAKNKLGKYEDSRLIYVFESGRTDAHLRDQLVLVH
jgi:hypothetical protein